MFESHKIFYIDQYAQQPEFELLGFLNGIILYYAMESL